MLVIFQGNFWEHKGTYIVWFAFSFWRGWFDFALKHRKELLKL